MHTQKDEILIYCDTYINKNITTNNITMCGIWFYMHKQSKGTLSQEKISNAFMQLSKRGPDRYVLTGYPKYNMHIGFHRLSIMDVSTKGDQPFIFETDAKLVYVICNGEIYNYRELCEKYNMVLKSGSDCEVILHLFKIMGINLIRVLRGEFAFCIISIDKLDNTVKVYAGRDQAGIRPLFIAGNKDEFVITSELKGSPFLDTYKYDISQIKPRHFLEITDFNQSYTEWINFGDFIPKINNYDLAKSMIRNTFEECVKCRLMSDRPIGCLLSGGLDSSLVASVAAKYCKIRGVPFYTFSLGMVGSTDEKYAKMVAQHIGSVHYHIVPSQEEMLNAVPEVIATIESYDVTSVRASTAQYLAVKWISNNTNIKVLLVGDGSDELCAGYMYFHNAPSDEELHNENVRLINDIHMYDVLRCDRTIAGNGLESRVPFLDTAFIHVYLSINPQLRKPTNGLEKWLLRDSFADTDYLPKEVLMRKKEAFSDGVSSVANSWYSMLQSHIGNIITDEYFDEFKQLFTHCVPHSKEALYYRLQFEKTYGTQNATAQLIPYFWLPKWVGNVTEPSARVLTAYAL